MDPSHERRAWLALAAVTGVGPRTCGALVRAFGSAAAAVRAPPSSLARVPGVGASRASALARGLASVDPAGLETEAAHAGCALLTPADARYPSALRESPDPPPALWVRGTLPRDDAPAVAVVGARGASPYGLRVAHGLAEALAQRGVVVVSGLARGIDGAAHAGALRGGGETVAVLGTGADVVYPPEHAGLSGEIVARGALVSEHPPGTPPHPGHFPRRNRIVAALTAVTVVVEAGLASGARGTARLALEAGREVMAVPGPVDRGTHAGCHRLLRDGASLCEGVDDVLATLGLASRGEGGAQRGPERALPLPPAGPPLVVFGVLDRDEVLDADALALRTGLSADAVGAALTRLELDGWAVRVPGVGYRRL